MGNPFHPVVHNDILTDFGENKTFLKRVESFLFYIWYLYMYHTKWLPAYDKYARIYFGEDMPYLGEIQNNISLLFINTNPIIQKSRPLVANTVDIGGGIHIQPKKPLPKVSNFIHFIFGRWFTARWLDF